MMMLLKHTIACGAVDMNKPLLEGGGFGDHWVWLGCEWHFDSLVHFRPQVGVYLRERIPVHRHGGELSLQQNERGGLHQREWNWEGLGCGGLCLSIAGWWLNWPTTLRHMCQSHCRSLPCPNSLIVNLGTFSALEFSHLREEMWILDNKPLKKSSFPRIKINSVIRAIIWQPRCISLSSKVTVCILEKPKQIIHQKEIVP